jgi:hypothetical protein
MSVEQLTHRECTRIATKLSRRLRKRLGDRTLEECDE